MAGHNDGLNGTSLSSGRSGGTLTLMPYYLSFQGMIREGCKVARAECKAARANREAAAAEQLRMVTEAFKLSLSS